LLAIALTIDDIKNRNGQLHNVKIHEEQLQNLIETPPGQRRQSVACDEMGEPIAVETISPETIETLPNEHRKSMS